MKKGICQLCLKENNLVKSHILSEFMYDELKDPIKGGMIQTSFKTKPNSPNAFLANTLYTGLYDDEILCEKCDNNVLGRLETYGALFIQGSSDSTPVGVILKEKSTKGLMVVGNIDYTKLKLFLLSILWRASISKKATFSQVSLGSKHTEKIRKMIINNDAGNSIEYPMVIYAHFVSDSITGKIISNPIKIKDHDGIRYFYFMGRIKVMYYISNHSIPPEVRAVLLRPSGEASLVEIDSERDQQFYEKFFLKPLSTKTTA